MKETIIWVILSFFRDDKKKQWKQGTALIRLGKTLYLKYGNWLRRVPIDTVIPDSNEEENIEGGFIEPAEPVKEDEEERFEEEDVPVTELAKDLETAEENQQLKEKVQKLEEQVSKSKEIIKEVTIDQGEHEHESGKEEDTEQVKRKERRKRQKMKKQEEKFNHPNLGQEIAFKENDSEDWIKAKVFRVFKKSSIYKDVKQMVLKDGSKIEKNFQTEIEDWKPLENLDDNGTDEDVNETYLLSSILGKKSLM